MPEEQIPPVVAVVVAHDPDTWFEQCLGSLAAQDYPQLVVLVVDAASEKPLANRVAAVDPSMYLQRLEDNRGFGPSVNAVLGLVEGAAYYLVCHDDVILEPDALRRMVEESYRSNAAVVGAKLVDVVEPDLILQLGLGVDRLGAPIRRVGHREFDQAQHDETREVFAVPGGVTLVRADLLDALGGFDPEISMLGEDVDLCWRARLAGARVVATPFAVVRHREATASRQRSLPDARALQRRHEIRCVAKNYEGARRAWRLTQLFVLSVAEVCYFLAVGHRRRAREVVDAWSWNFSRAQRLSSRRNELRAVRRLSDREATELMTGHTSRFRRYLRPGIEQLSLRWSTNSEMLLRWADERKAVGGDIRPRFVTYAVTIGVLALLVGVRSLLVAPLPLIGQYLPLPSPGALVGHFFAGSTYASTQSAGPVTPALLFLGLVGFVFIGAMGIVFKLGLVLAVVLGGVGVVRLVRPFGPPVARSAAVLCYLYLPLAWNDVARADVRGLVAYAAMPYVLSRLCRATGEAPFDTTHATAVRSSAVVGELVALGLCLTVAAAFEPALVIITPLVACFLYLGSLAVRGRAASPRGLVVGLGASAIAIVALFPWSLTFFQPQMNAGALVGASQRSVGAANISQLFRLNLGPYGSGWLAWGLIVGATYVLVAGRRLRFEWAVRFWVVALAFVAVDWLAGQGFIGSGIGAQRSFAAPFAVAIAAAVGLGAATVVEDLRQTNFGLSQIAAVAFVALSALGALPILGATLNGRFRAPSTGYASLLSWMGEGGRARSGGPSHVAMAPGQRILWLGNPAALPLVAWQIQPGLGFGLSRGGLPLASAIWPSAHLGEARRLVAELEAAETGSTVDLGAALAHEGIRYLVVPTSVAPNLLGTQSSAPAPAPQILLDALANQTDLHQLPSEGGALVFENTVGARALQPRTSSTARLLQALASALECLIFLVLLRAGLKERRRRQAARRRARQSGATLLADPAPGAELRPLERLA